ncbi:hypothetical protein [Pseudarthrobacter sp. L1SW]|uniref:hypothetical protein n=1 Tax=Pseudarthrobacter sp. L1SW TaxID=2851598 RepID=UPI001E3D5AE6|nr:hypothetical protein [Pseudarthrobacter sp. L1SW]UEL30092.1 hypothetical protein KTR40_08400 [Pseudarthrobacter sp. L1SW]
MNDLVEFVQTKHGSNPSWKAARGVSAKLRVHGVFWPFKGQPDLLGDVTVTAELARQRVSITPFGEGQTLTFDAARDLVTVTDATGAVVDSLSAPRLSMAGYLGDTQWSPTQMGYFISYATWTYLAEPLLFTLPGVRTREIDPWDEDGETWRRLEVTFPESIHSHSKVQTYYFDAETGLQRRMDYDVEVNGWAEVAHYTSEHKDFQGLSAPTRRRVLLRDKDNNGIHTFAAILLDLTDLRPLN